GHSGVKLHHRLAWLRCILPPRRLDHGAPPQVRDVVVFFPGIGPVLFRQPPHAHITDLAEADLAQVPEPFLNPYPRLLATRVSGHVDSHGHRSTRHRQRHLPIILQRIRLLDGHSASRIAAHDLGDRLHDLWLRRHAKLQPILWHATPPPYGLTAEYAEYV